MSGKGEMGKAHREVFGQTLARLGLEIPELVVLDADLSKSTKTSVFAKAFPGRFHDMGISEQDMLATAAGLATAGLTPVASTFAIFGTGRAWEQLRNSICYPPSASSSWPRMAASPWARTAAATRASRISRPRA